MHARLDAGDVRLLTRTGLDWTQKYQLLLRQVIYHGFREDKPAKMVRETGSRP